MHPLARKLKIRQWLTVTNHAGWATRAPGVASFPFPGIIAAVHIQKILAGQLNPARPLAATKFWLHLHNQSTVHFTCDIAHQECRNIAYVLIL